MVADTRTLRIDVKDNVSMPVKKMSRTLDELKRATMGMAETFDRAQREVDQLGDEFEDASRKGKKTETTFQRLRKSAMSLKGAFVGIGAGLVAQQFVKMADTATRLENRLRLVTNSSRELKSVQEGLLGISQRTRTGLEGTTELYSRLARVSGDLGLSQTALLGVTETINQAILISGSSAESANSALVQLGQGMASGTLRGEELNSVMEQTPRLARALADGMGIGIGKLRELGQEGKITSQAIIKAIQSQQKVIREEVAKTQITVDQSFVQLGNSAVTFAGALDEATGITSNLALVISNLADLLDKASKAMQERDPLESDPLFGNPNARGRVGSRTAQDYVSTRNQRIAERVEEANFESFGPSSEDFLRERRAQRMAQRSYIDQQRNIDFMGRGRVENQRAGYRQSDVTRAFSRRSEGAFDYDAFLKESNDAFKKRTKEQTETRKHFDNLHRIDLRNKLKEERELTVKARKDNAEMLRELAIEEQEQARGTALITNTVTNALAKFSPEMGKFAGQINRLANAFASGNPIEKGIAVFETANDIFSTLTGSAGDANSAMAELNKKVRDLAEGANEQALKNNPAFAGTVDALTDPFEVLFNAILARFMDIDTLANVASQRGISIEEAKIVQQQGAVEAFYGAVGDVGVERDEKGRFVRPRGSSQKIRDIGEIQRLQGTGRAEQILDSRQLDQIIINTFGDLGQFTERIKTFFGADASWVDVATEALAGMDAFEGLSSSIERTTRASKALTETESKVARLRFQGEAIQARTDLQRDMRLAGGDVYLQQQVMSRFQAQIESIGRSSDLAGRGGGAGGTGGAGGADGMGQNPSSVEYTANPENVRGAMNTAQPIYNNAINDFANSFDTVVVDLSQFIDFTATGIRGQIISAVEDAIADRAIG
tara:strand:+ start:3128 stop:5815 length:2688 start_codon:yes stop_codon:yes gene_type:complete